MVYLIVTTIYFHYRQLVSASPGTPLLDFSFVKENDETLMMQVTYSSLFIMIEKMNLGLVLLHNNVLAQAALV